MIISSSSVWLRISPNLLLQLIHSSAIHHARKTHYETLGLEQTASRKDIRSAFLTLSKQHHPDINKSEDAHKHFMEINEAYDVLYSPGGRYTYDLQLRTGTHHTGFTHPATAAYHYDGNYHNISEQEWAQMYQKSMPKRNHAPLILILVAVMFTGSLVHSYRIQATHKQFQEMADLETRRNIEVYNNVRERAANSTLSEQLERLSQKHRESREQ